MILSAVITEAEEGGYIAHNPETRTTPRGETFDEAIENLREATGLYLEEFPMKAGRPPRHFPSRRQELRGSAA